MALYNIGRSAERVGKMALALRSYEAYLRALPGASNRSAVEAAIHRLRARLPARVGPRRVAPGRTDTRARPRRRARPRPGGVKPPPQTATRPQPGRALGVAGWTAVGTGAALAVVAGVLGDLADRERSAVENADPGTEWKPGLSGRADAFDRYRTGAWVAAGVGAAALVTGTVLLIVGRKGRRAERVTLTPVIGPGGAGLSLGGRF